ncbi:hypothetical protein ACNOYE_25665 [Nannocystaceae bacterium ST9]
MRRPNPPEPDHSSALDVGERPWVRVWLARAGSFEPSIHRHRGRVGAIEPFGEGHRIALNDERGIEVAPIGVELPRRCPLPVELGDSLIASTRARVLGIHPVIEGCLVDERGVLRAAALSESHAELLPPSWTIERGPVARREPARHAGMAESLDLWLIVRHRDRAAWVESGEWRELVTSEGTYWIGGRASAWGPGNLVPDASNETAAWIVRVG